MNTITPTNKRPPKLTGRNACQKLGNIPDCAIPVFVHASVLETIFEFSAQQMKREQGGFLVGGYHAHDFEFVEISHFSPAVATRNALSSLTFTHQTWADITQKMNAEFSGLQIVGWQHTHPGFGIFMSQHDLFIHRNFFAQPWQVAMVVDPQKEEMGMFQWVDDELINCGFLCVPGK